jgi:hypothetical protein
LIDLADDRDRWGECKSGNELSGFTKCGEFLDKLRTDYLLEKDSASAPWSVR